MSYVFADTRDMWRRMSWPQLIGWWILLPWRLAWIPVYLLLAFLLCCVYGITAGWKPARRMWKDVVHG